VINKGKQSGIIKLLRGIPIKAQGFSIIKRKMKKKKKITQ